MTIIEIPKCYQCKKEVSSNRTLLKLKDGNRYCLTCITYYKKTLFSQLEINGYWYSLLINQVNSKYRSKKIKNSIKLKSKNELSSKKVIK